MIVDHILYVFFALFAWCRVQAKAEPHQQISARRESRLHPDHVDFIQRFHSHVMHLQPFQVCLCGISFGARVSTSISLNVWRMASVLPSAAMRRFQWCHQGREDIIIEKETKHPRSNPIQLVFGAQFNFRQSGFHGEWFDLNKTTVFLREIRYSGQDAQWKHNLIFLLDPSATRRTWRCTSFPIRIVELDAPLPLAWGSLSSLEDIESGRAGQVWREYLDSSAGSDTSSASMTPSCSSENPSLDSMRTYGSWTWADFQRNRTVV